MQQIATKENSGNKSKKSLYFVAMVLEHKTSELVRSWQEDMCKQFKVCKSLTSPPHITLVPPFRTTVQFAEHIEAMMKNYVLNFYITANNISHFGDRVIFVDVLSNQKLSDLRHVLISQIAGMGIEIRARKKFRPHITIGHKIPKGTFPFAWNHFKDYEMTRAVHLTGPVLFIHQDGMWKYVV